MLFRRHVEARAATVVEAGWHEHIYVESASLVWCGMRAGWGREENKEWALQVGLAAAEASWLCARLGHEPRRAALASRMRAGGRPGYVAHSRVCDQ